MANVSGAVTFRWKGKIVSKKIYEKRLAQRKGGLNRKKAVAAEGVEVTTTESENGVNNDNYESTDQEEKYQKPTLMDGNRIVDLKTLGKQMWCVSCKKALSLDYIENETRLGLGSQLSVRCHHCQIINQVSTSKQRKSQDKRSIRFDTNYKAVLSILHTGLGWTQLSKMCACLNIPCLDSKTYKKYETEIRLAAEKVANSSCADATTLERKLTLEQVESIAKLLQL